MARLMICLGVVVLLTGCVFPSQPDCEVIQTSALRAQFNQETSLNQFTAWVANTYHVSSKAIRVIPSVDDGNRWIVHWEVAGRTYEIFLDDGRMGAWAGVSFDREVPAAQVISCLGTPAQYYARYNWDLGKYALHLTLLYPDQGILATGARYYSPKPTQVPTIENTFGIYRLTFGSPGWTEGLQQSAANPNGEPYKPWPDDWQAIAIDVDPRARP